MSCLHAHTHTHTLAQVKGKRKTNKASFEQIKLALETQTRVSESLEHERDRAYDDFEMAQVGTVIELLYIFIGCDEMHS